MAATKKEYYDDKASHGNYQTVNLCEVLDSLELEAKGDSDSYLKGTQRFLLRKYALEGLRDMSFNGAASPKCLELTIGTNLQFVLPQNYVDYHRLSVVGADCKLHTLDYNKNINLSKSYLQDHDYEIIFDSDGDVIDVDGMNAINKPHQIYEFGASYEDYIRNDNHFSNYSVNTDTAKFSKFGEFNIDKECNVIVFSSNLAGKTIVLEFISDGLDEELIDDMVITVHKYYKEALEDYIYHRAIARKRNVPDREKSRASRKFKTSRHRAVIKLANYDPQQIMRLMRSSFKPVKT